VFCGVSEVSNKYSNFFGMAAFRNDSAMTSLDPFHDDKKVVHSLKIKCFIVKNLKREIFLSSHGDEGGRVRTQIHAALNDFTSSNTHTHTNNNVNWKKILKRDKSANKSSQISHST
jgi:hypothetical protein